jgi:hypothetical protein
MGHLRALLQADLHAGLHALLLGLLLLLRVPDRDVHRADLPLAFAALAMLAAALPALCLAVLAAVAFWHVAGQLLVGVVLVVGPPASPAIWPLVGLLPVDLAAGLQPELRVLAAVLVVLVLCHAALHKLFGFGANAAAVFLGALAGRVPTTRKHVVSPFARFDSMIFHVGGSFRNRFQNSRQRAASRSRHENTVRCGHCGKFSWYTLCRSFFLRQTFDNEGA